MAEPVASVETRGRENSVGLWLCSLAMITVGSTVVASRLIGAQIEPFLATALRHAAALPLFIFLMWVTRSTLPRLGARDWTLIVLQAAAGSVGYTVLLIVGVTWSSAAEAGIVAGTLPAVSAVFSVMFLGERPGWRLALSIALATAGVMTVAFSPEAVGATASTRHLAGLALVLAAVVCEAIFILANKRLSEPVSPLALSTLMSAGGLALALLPALMRLEAAPSAFTPASLLAVLYYGWIPTVAGFLLWYAGSERVSGSRASLTTVWLPVSALLLSAMVLGEQIRAWQWVGLACVVAAVLMAPARDNVTAPSE